MTDIPATFQREPGATATSRPAASSIVHEDLSRSLALALVAGALVAVLGGLLWAAVVIKTNYDIGILAWFVGAAVGIVIARIAGGPVATAPRLAAGAFAAVGIMVGKYVIFIHAVKAFLGTELAGQGASVSYLDGTQVRIFVEHLGTFVKPIYALWVALAFFAAFRTAGGERPIGRRR